MHFCSFPSSIKAPQHAYISASAASERLGTRQLSIALSQRGHRRSGQSSTKKKYQTKQYLTPLRLLCAARTTKTVTNYSSQLAHTNKQAHPHSSNFYHSHSGPHLLLLDRRPRHPAALGLAGERREGQCGPQVPGLRHVHGLGRLARHSRHPRWDQPHLQLRPG